MRYIFSVGLPFRNHLYCAVAAFVAQVKAVAAAATEEERNSIDSYRYFYRASAKRACH